MKYDSPKLRDMLAAEYALGTLRGPARRRFEKLLARDRRLGDLVEDWSARLNLMAETVPAIAPHPRVWRAIEARLDRAGAAQASARPSHALRLWRALAVFSSAVAVTLLVYVGLGPVRAPDVAPVAVLLSDPAGKQGWIVRLVAAPKGAAQMRVATLGPPSAAPGKSFELWVLPASGAAPISLGLLPEQGEGLLSMPPAALSELAGAAALAVSLEPAGGSPTGAPTGPVLTQGRLTRL